MAAGLNLLKKLIVEGGKPAREAERRIGEAFLEAAETRPEMFRLGRKYLGDTDADLEAQFGVKIERVPREYRRPDEYMTPDVQIFPAADPRRAPAGLKYKSRVGLMNDPTLASDTFRSWREIADLPERSRFMSIDTGSLGNLGQEGGGGSGAGRGVYGAAYGTLLRRPDTYNFVSSLTPRNEHRRNYAQAAAIMREPRLGRQVLISQPQVKFSAEKPRGSEFRLRAPEEQVGALQAEGALQLMHRLDRTTRHADTYPDSGVGRILSDVIPGAYDPAEFHQAANLLRRSGAPAIMYDTVGDAALRRAALVNDIMERRSGRGHLYDLLEYSRGGRVSEQPRGSVGCGCGGDV